MSGLEILAAALLVFGSGLGIGYLWHVDRVEREALRKATAAADEAEAELRRRRARGGFLRYPEVVEARAYGLGIPVAEASRALEHIGHTLGGRPVDGCEYCKAADRG